jgi:hypothetical protein
MNTVSADSFLSRETIDVSKGAKRIGAIRYRSRRGMR